MTAGSDLPLAGLRVVEVAAAPSTVANGPAACAPGALLRDFGAEVVRIESGAPSPLDAGVDYARSWNRGKQIDDSVDPTELGRVVANLVCEADVLLLSGPEPVIEGAGVVHGALAARNRRLVTGRVRPSVNGQGPVPDVELLVHARTGLLGQVPAPHGRPSFCAVPLAGFGAAFALTAGVLARLYERECTGAGGWVETSLYDGLYAMVPMIVGRAEHPSPATDMLWRQQGPTVELSHRCADGTYVQLWFGAKGAYEEFLACMGEPPTEIGYTAEMVSGVMEERSRRWAERFSEHDRAHWIERLAGHGFRCDPVLRPGDLLSEPHLREVGLSIDIDDAGGRRLTMLGPVGKVVPTGTPSSALRTAAPEGALLSGVRVLDLSAYLAGPVAARILADLGADVIKVEPPTGDVHRSLEPLFAAGQRGKRTLAMDLKSDAAADVLRRLFAWSDIVHHNSRVGLAERLGYDEATARAANADVVYHHASGFGASGPWARQPSNDYVMQALTGMAAGLVGPGQAPIVNSWGSIDTAGGWISACSIIAGLCARRRTRRGQSVSSSLIGAGIALQSGTFLVDGSIADGPVVDPDLTGFGAAYRTYRGSDDRWFALAVLDQATWSRLRDVVEPDDLAATLPALRIAGEGEQPDEAVLAACFATRPAAASIDALRRAGIPVEPVLDADRQEFVAHLIDDPVNARLGRVVAFDWGARGRIEHQGPAIRVGPTVPDSPRPALPGIGEHGDDILALLGFDGAARARLVADGTVRGPDAAFS